MKIEFMQNIDKIEVKKKVKIIDLLYKIANKEIKLGTKFIWQHIDENITLIFMERYGALGLYFEEGIQPDGEIRWIGLFERYNYQILNDEVEILDDEFEDIEEYFAGVELEYNKNEYQYKINQLIKNQKKIIEMLKKEGK